ncbi:prolyl oligopeptidase family serine peptidase [Algoriphagus sp. H41]|uniref:Prolyl oligopeptidase family serine peptidase n=1 Tax=Algoriphagus oliviformis TaxID=2811231 RepID=A0ABS3C9G3_9BACT|nr:alpha/beta hydrolase-fold protein [Algoriphagus oliviformis]MBN7812806.1 prolyl oligopeptidase family serine peptidase [Algoriphagus oliviformis]
MLKALKTVWIVGFMVLLQHHAVAQGGRVFLQKVGVLDSLYSSVLQESRKIYVQLPASFDPGKKQKYPVAYVLDGEVFLPTVSEVQNYYSGGFTPEMVLVGISNDKHRVRDLTISSISSKYGMPFNGESGGATDFLRFIETELIPFVESKYPVTQYRTLIGHSYGGLFTISALVEQPDLFANYLAIDPSLDWDGQKLSDEFREAIANQDYRNKALFVSLSGQLHMQDSKVTLDNVMQDTTDFTLFARSNIAFSDMVKQHAGSGLAFDWKFYPGDIHGTVPFPSLMDGLISLFEWYQMENTDKINSFDTPKEELLGIIKHREQKLKEHFGYPEPPYPEELLNVSGYMNMDTEQPEKAKMYFELAIEYYPESANAYDSMADYYEAQGDFTSAIECVTKAYGIDGGEFYRKRMEELEKMATEAVN